MNPALPTSPRGPLARLFPALTALLILLGLSSPALAQEIFVPGDYPTIQAAIDAAVDGDVVRVAPGVYGESVVWQGKAIALIGAGAGATIIDPGGRGRCLTLIDLPVTARVERLTCRGGRAEVGGGVLVRGGSPTFLSCVFRDNLSTAGSGGGLRVEERATVTLNDCAFRDNMAIPAFTQALGGGVYATEDSHVNAIDCEFMGNRADRGGGMTADRGSSATVAGSHFENNEGGLLIQDGSADVSGSTFVRNWSHGGMDVFFSTALVSDSVFRSNSHLVRGGGLMSRLSDVRVVRCVFTGNRAPLGGGAGIVEGDAELIDSQFVNNRADRSGGAVFIFGRLTASGVAFQGNTAGENGGAVAVDSDSFADMDRCQLSRNWAGGHGGALYIRTPFDAAVTRCDIRSNSAQGDGGGAYLAADGGVRVSTCVFARNVAGGNGGALAVPRELASVINATLWGNVARGTGGGLRVGADATVDVVNSILWANAAPQISSAGTLAVTYSIVQGGYPGVGNLDADPLFRAPARGDLRLQAGSPARDAGILVPGMTATDLDGNPRVVGPAPDMGAYELGPGLR